jgi:energy-converting hydrogenase Eha subunit F
MTQPLRLAVCLVVLVGFPLAATAQEFDPKEQLPSKPVEKIDDKDLDFPAFPPGFPSSDESALPPRFPQYEYKYTPINVPYTPPSYTPSSSGRGVFGTVVTVLGGIVIAIFRGMFGRRRE